MVSHCSCQSFPSLVLILFDLIILVAGSNTRAFLNSFDNVSVGKSGVSYKSASFSWVARDGSGCRLVSTTPDMITSKLITFFFLFNLICLLDMFKSALYS